MKTILYVIQHKTTKEFLSGSGMYSELTSNLGEARYHHAPGYAKLHLGHYLRGYRNRSHTKASFEIVPVTVSLGEEPPVPDDYEYLHWFRVEADFGPADGDVKAIMDEQYEAETGNPVPENWRREE